MPFALQVDTWFGQQSKDQINVLNASSWIHLGFFFPLHRNQIILYWKSVNLLLQERRQVLFWRKMDLRHVRNHDNVNLCSSSVFILKVQFYPFKASLSKYKRHSKFGSSYSVFLWLLEMVIFFTFISHRKMNL